MAKAAKKDDAQPKEVVRKTIGSKKLITMLKVADHNTEEVASINGEFRNSLVSASEHDGLNLKAWPTFRAIWRARKRSHADARRLAEDIQLGVQLLLDDLDTQSELALGGEAEPEDSEDSDLEPSEAEKDEFDAEQAAALANAEKLNGGISQLDPPAPPEDDAPKRGGRGGKRESQSARADRIRAEAGIDQVAKAMPEPASNVTRFNKRRTPATAH